MDVSVLPPLAALIVSWLGRRLLQERGWTRAFGVLCIAAALLFASLGGLGSLPSLPNQPAATSVDLPLFAAAALATLVASIAVCRPRIGPLPSSVLLLSAAGLFGGLHPFVPVTVLWWFADRDAFRRPWWTFAALIAAAVGLDHFRDDRATAAACLVTVSLVAAWASRPHLRQQSVISASFAAIILLRFGWLTGPESVREIATAAAVSSVALLTLAAGRQARPDRSQAGVATAIASALLVLAAAAECLGSEASGTMLLAIAVTICGAAVVECRIREVGRLRTLGLLGVTTLLPALPLTSGLLWWPAVASLLTLTVTSPMTGVPEPSGSAGLIATLIVAGPLFSAGRWLVEAGPHDLARVDGS